MDEWVKEYVPCFLQSKGCISCWVETGRYLTRLIMGFLVFSPVLEKVRTFLVEPRRDKIKKYRENLEEDVATFADTVDGKDARRFEDCRKKFDKICADLQNDSQGVLNVCYILCLVGAGLGILCMTLGWDLFLGPGAVLLIWPLIIQIIWLGCLGKKACKSADDVQQVVDSLKRDYLNQNAEDNNAKSKALKWPKK